MTDDAERPDMERRKEPAFNAPLMAVVLPLLLIGCYALQTSGGALLDKALFTHIFLHGNWTHVLFNAAACLIFATPVIRAFGKGFGATLSFLGFFLMCGVAAGLGYCLVNMSSAVQMVGASGAIYGLIGASSRIAGVRGVSGGIVPLTNPRILSSAAVWIGINLATALLPFLPGGQGIVIAWQAHIAGYLFGVLIIGHWLKAFHPRFFTRI